MARVGSTKGPVIVRELSKEEKRREGHKCMLMVAQKKRPKAVSERKR